VPAAGTSIRAIEKRLAFAENVGRAFTGVSLASILLLAALGLAITYGVMGVINMAHGELLMVGAYSAWAMQSVFQAYFPNLLDWYLLAAIPVGFCAAALVGVLMERVVIRHLYGRPLETLLATWGISLFLIQVARTVFGAQNVEVANPVWMAGGIEVLPNLLLPWNRIIIIGFSVAVLAAMWSILNLSRMGMFVRAVTQNRPMAGCVGVPTGAHRHHGFRPLVPASPDSAAWRCRRSPTSARTWGRATSSIRSWSSFSAASGSSPARSGQRSASA
jgi:urea transport system permease protein